MFSIINSFQNLLPLRYFLILITLYISFKNNTRAF
nr:MAG TPA: hypothetical protein [Caudoviricetes sp.]